ncbi:hypothetical protein H696_06075 [Fonticula alba]|uniref:Uncharacterized protein n=1 Tax=Fonticula alba TaxID=691883 RepID=A0A058Z0B2_FONAL|nr:hypothetical protein H696_06075 [Fonticula alba]KCV67556.1 hypothetical protein H696_06075 [Fonticula alba]|eukprot:XP_009498117.1 hypothetical protein H696_06075 [Fonticula alba]
MAAATVGGVILPPTAAGVGRLAVPCRAPWGLARLGSLGVGVSRPGTPGPGPTRVPCLGAPLGTGRPSRGRGALSPSPSRACALGLSSAWAVGLRLHVKRAGMRAPPPGRIAAVAPVAWTAPRHCSCLSAMPMVSPAPLSVCLPRAHARMCLRAPLPAGRAGPGRGTGLSLRRCLPGRPPDPGPWPGRTHLGAEVARLHRAPPSMTCMWVRARRMPGGGWASQAGEGETAWASTPGVLGAGSALGRNIRRFVCLSSRRSAALGLFVGLSVWVSTRRHVPAWERSAPGGRRHSRPACPAMLGSARQPLALGSARPHGCEGGPFSWGLGPAGSASASHQPRAEPCVCRRPCRSQGDLPWPGKGARSCASRCRGGSHRRAWRGGGPA